MPNHLEEINRSHSGLLSETIFGVVDGPMGSVADEREGAGQVELFEKLADDFLSYFGGLSV